MAKKPIHTADSPFDGPMDPPLALTGNKKNIDIINLQQSINMRDSVISGGTKINYQLSSDDNESQNDLITADAKPFVAQESQILIDKKSKEMKDKTHIDPSALSLNLEFKEADFDNKNKDPK